LISALWGLCNAVVRLLTSCSIYMDMSPIRLKSFSCCCLLSLLAPECYVSAESAKEIRSSLLVHNVFIGHPSQQKAAYLSNWCMVFPLPINW